MTGQEEVVFSFPSVITEGASLMYGSQANTLLINFSFTKETTLIDLIKQAESYFANLESSGAKYLPVGDLVKKFDVRESLEIAFVQSNLRYSKNQISGVITEVSGAHHDNDSLYVDLNATLMFEQEERDNLLYFRVRYKNQVLDKVLVENFSKTYQGLFVEMTNGLFDEISKGGE
jgi:hypothetical protein